jgi:hypothetical protein
MTDSGTHGLYDGYVMGGCMGCHGNAQFPRKPDKDTGTGPSIFNFLTTAETLTGQGFTPDPRDITHDQLVKRARPYMRPYTK